MRVRTKKKAGWNTDSHRKEDAFAACFRLSLRRSKSLPNFTYHHLDLTAGPGRVPARFGARARDSEEFQAGGTGPNLFRFHVGE